MGRQRKNGRTHTEGALRRTVHWSGHGRASWPSRSNPKRHYSLRVAEDRKHAVCACRAARSLSPGELCEHGSEALEFVRTYVDPRRLWTHAFHFQLADKTKSAIGATKSKRNFFDDIERSPETEYNLPGGQTLRSQQNRARRKWNERVPELMDQLMRGSASRLDAIALRHRMHLDVKTGRRSAGAGCKPSPLARRLYATVSRAFSDSLADEAGRLADSIQANQRLQQTPSEGSICNFFHDVIVLTGLRIWLSMTARAVSRLSQYTISDSTGFASSPVEVWIESEHGTLNIRCTSTWLKAHVLSCAATNVVLAIIPTSNRGRSADVTMLKHLLRIARKACPNIRAVLGDKAYFSKKVRDWCAKLGMVLFVELKEGLTEETRAEWDQHNGVISLRHVFKRLMRYRPKVESVFSAWKRMFNPYASTRISKHFGPRRSGLSLSQEIELFAKAIAYNLRRLATLEAILDQEIDLARGIYFYPMPDDWVSPECESLLTAPDLLPWAA